MTEKPEESVKTASDMGMIPEPSEEFLEAFSEGSSGVIVECDFCGRVYFATDDFGDFEEGELEELREKAKKEPDKYIEVDYFTSRVAVEGKTYPWKCKCNMVRRYEDWIWSNRRQIVRFLKAKTERRFKAAEDDYKAIQTHLKLAEGCEGAEDMEREILRKLLNKYPDENGVYSLRA